MRGFSAGDAFMAMEVSGGRDFDGILGGGNLQLTDRADWRIIVRTDSFRSTVNFGTSCGYLDRLRAQSLTQTTHHD